MHPMGARFMVWSKIPMHPMETSYTLFHLFLRFMVWSKIYSCPCINGTKMNKRCICFLGLRFGVNEVGI